MRDTMLTPWPQGRIDARSPDRRWLRVASDALDVVHLRRDAGEEPCTPHVVPAIGDRAGAIQETHATRSEAVTAPRRLVEKARAASARRRAPALAAPRGGLR
jgi:hypothetical protein